MQRKIAIPITETSYKNEDPKRNDENNDFVKLISMINLAIISIAEMSSLANLNSVPLNNLNCDFHEFFFNKILPQIFHEALHNFSLADIFKIVIK